MSQAGVNAREFVIGLWRRGWGLTVVLSRGVSSIWHGTVRLVTAGRARTLTPDRRSRREERRRRKQLRREAERAAGAGRGSFRKAA